MKPTSSKNARTCIGCLTYVHCPSHVRASGITRTCISIFFSPLHSHLEEEMDEVLVGGFRSNHAEGRDVLLTGIGRDDEAGMSHALENIVAEKSSRPSLSILLMIEA